MPVLSRELVEFLEGPNSIVVATHDGKLHPEVTRGLTLRCTGDDTVRVWLPARPAARAVANLALEKRIAVAVELPSLHKTRQLKGVVTAVRPAPDDRRALIDEAFAGFSAQCATIGVPPRLLERVVLWPAVEIELRVDAVFEQTPGPGAGEPLEAAKR
jgi:hypothetical protein